MIFKMLAFGYVDDVSSILRDVAMGGKRSARQ